ncbi:hypothetical protein pEaSNUABM50_00040 [Erwinia phage pEa_SNUABM_50]|uniref:Uncharacterized protein n=4 Tax=Eneladusvirus BF TaxID=2560751 RepID=A0A7L8ZM37_9CAUD|nr:hypothetical protein FDH34_gp042 [Serratia phage BF]QOI70980.1 hypothetical protein pEaSNUABM12_00042 [Erwinia phage pEa_SNUABM_12]QOI71525.1 hypothetical protein pEaSNUABM47_00041 [Erwinia phage pEa_SNUABM_47]QOI72064.1 hypothetical protein pEaSNUABM50_00040 [Erwinia phage pEa_SNUABM_50]QXO11189.1 hypothetical protein pEaSNUABM19_00043 [Erwinia phage pEa_SNUABM_19]QXO11737.1 hypothetical protein pEaSNUABM44_00041 [Erwinia phage pEa_SNUABM_44]QXO12288.1 hypothetical protein pEaSNUABM49_000
MFNVVGCLGVTIGQADSIDTAITLVQSQITVSDKKRTAMRNALQRLKVGQQYQIDYGGTGCTVQRVEG